MTLDFLPNGSPDCPILRLSRFTPDEASRLASAVSFLAAGEVSHVAVHDLPGVTSIDHCRLTFHLRSWDQGLIQSGPNAFDCGLTSGAWEDVAGRIEPFEAGSTGYQWLLDVPGDIPLLLSAEGPW